MRTRQPLPRLWLMTDERSGDALWDALRRLPPGSGVIFRHYATANRRALFEYVRAIARRRRLVLVLAGDPRQAVAWRADGAHGPSPHVRASRRLVRTAAAHGPRDLGRARAHLLFLSPVFATRSHPGCRTVGRVRFGLWARRAAVPLIALGGMDKEGLRALKVLGAYGWAGIDAFTGNASPIRT